MACWLPVPQHWLSEDTSRMEPSGNWLLGSWASGTADFLSLWKYYLFYLGHISLSIYSLSLVSLRSLVSRKYYSIYSIHFAFGFRGNLHKFSKLGSSTENYSSWDFRVIIYVHVFSLFSLPPREGTEGIRELVQSFARVHRSCLFDI